MSGGGWRSWSHVRPTVSWRSRRSWPPTCSLTALGVGSLAFLRLIDALEEEYGVQIDLAAPAGALDSLDEIVAHLGATR
ncbi:hypothetical protein GCM10020219_077410 [Nonomuraea dietziae]